MGRVSLLLFHTVDWPTARLPELNADLLPNHHLVVLHTHSPPQRRL
jgi:hypothetical protein